MTFTPYATPTDLTDWLAPDDAPDDATGLLRSATFVVAEACNRSPYSAAPSGQDADALRDATCAQAASWSALGINPDALGIDGPSPVKKTSILGADVEYDTKASVEARSLAARELAPQAATILTSAGLLWMPTATGAPCEDGLPTYGLSGGRLGVSPTWANSTDAWPFV